MLVNVAKIYKKNIKKKLWLGNYFKNVKCETEKLIKDQKLLELDNNKMKQK